MPPPGVNRVKELPKLSLSFLKVVRKLSDSCVNGFDLSHSCPEIVYKLPSCCSEKELLVELISNGGIIHLKCILMIQKVKLH